MIHITRISVVLLCIFLSFSSVSFAKISGSGASFPYPFLEEVFKVYKSQHNITVEYKPHGSKNGYLDLKQQNVDFAAIDLYLNDALMEQLPHPTDILHFPITLSAIGMAYSIPGVSNLRLSPELVSEILIGRITHWDAPAIQALNPNIQLPHLKIILITRAKGSGSTYVLTQYLTYLNPAWKSSFGVTAELNIPGTLIAKSSDEVGELLSQIPGSFGYIGTAYQRPYNLSFAAMKNAAGNFVYPSLDSIKEAATLSIPKDGRISCIFTDAPQGYPITSFSWLILYQEQFYQKRSKKHAEKIVHFLKWMITYSPNIADQLRLPSLPENAQQTNQNLLKQLTYKSKTLSK